MNRAVRLDHVGIVGRDLDKLLGAARSCGFAPTPPKPLLGRDPATGAALDLGQTSAHLVFESGYVELSAVHSRSPDHHLARYLGQDPGLHILALGVDDIQAAHQRCQAAGLAVTAVAAASREIRYGERHGEARFEWFMLDPEASPEGLVCWVRQLTPELVFQPAVQHHPNGTAALTAVQVAVPDPGGAVAHWSAVTGASPTRHETAIAFDVEDGRIELVTPAGFAARFPGARVPPCPGLAGFELRVRDLAATQALLAAGSGPARRSATGGLHADLAGSLVAFAG